MPPLTRSIPPCCSPNDSTLGQIVAVKDQSAGNDGIRFVSSLQNFNLSLGSTASGLGSGQRAGHLRRHRAVRPRRAVR